MIQAKGKLLNWGNSVGIRLNKFHLTGTPIEVNDNVEIKIKKCYTKGKEIYGRTNNHLYP